MKKVSRVPLVHPMIIAIGAGAKSHVVAGSGAIVNLSGVLRSNVRRGSVFVVHCFLGFATRSRFKELFMKDKPPVPPGEPRGMNKVAALTM